MHHATDFHREIVSEMGELGVLGPTIKGETNKKTNAPPPSFFPAFCYISLITLSRFFKLFFFFTLQGTVVQVRVMWHMV